MSKVVQEKFQVNEPYNSNDDSQSGWVDNLKARVKKGTPGREGRHGGDWPSKKMDNAVLYNTLPAGMDLTDQEMADTREMTLSGPYGNGTQVTNDLTATSVREGFSRKELRPQDDMYTREHHDAFYDEVVVDGVKGYLERNNTLDRS